MTTQMINDMMIKEQRSKLFMGLLHAFECGAEAPQSPEKAVAYAMANLLAFGDGSQASVPQILTLSEAINTRRFQTTTQTGAVTYDYESLLDTCPTANGDATRAAMMLAGCYVNQHGLWVDGEDPLPGVLVNLSGISVDTVLADVPEPRKAVA